MGFLLRLVGLLGLILSINIAHAAPAYLALPEESTITSLDLSGYWQVFDESVAEQLEQAMHDDTVLPYHAQSQLVLSANQPDLWVKLNFDSNKASQNWFLQVGSAELTRITLYFYDQRQQPSLQTNGRVYPNVFTQPLLQSTGNYLLPLTLNPGKQAVILHLHHPITTPVQLNLISQAGLDLQRSIQQPLGGLITGLLLLFILLPLCLGKQYKYLDFYLLGLANCSWILAYLCEQKIGPLAQSLAIITQTPTLNFVLMSLGLNLYVWLCQRNSLTHTTPLRWQQGYRLLLAIIFVSACLQPLLPNPVWQQALFSIVIIGSAGWILVCGWYCRQVDKLTRGLISALAITSVASSLVDNLLINLPFTLTLPHHWVHLVSLLITLGVAHTLIQQQHRTGQRSNQHMQQQEHKQLSLQVRQAEWHNRLHQQCLQQIQITVGSLLPLTDADHLLAPVMRKVHQALQRVEALAADGPVQDIPFLLKPLLLDLAKTCRDQCKNKNLQLHIAFDKKLPVAVRSDARLLHRLLQELLHNAVHFTEQGDVIFKVSAQPQANNTFRLDFLIQDTGTGLPVEQQQPVLQKKASNKKTSPNIKNSKASVTEQGLAMGLVICRHLIYLLQGSLQIKSVLGQGSRFLVRITLPSVDPDQVTAASLSTSSIRPTSNRKAGVELALIVDDDRTTQQSLTAALKKLGYKTLIATNGPAALDLLALNAIDIVFMDYEMPHMNGFETLIALRAQPHQHHLRVVAISSHPQAEFEQVAITDGFNAYLEKPVTIAKINSLLNKLNSAQ